MPWIAKQLGQLRPANTTNNVLAAGPPASKMWWIPSLLITNTSGADATCRLFHHNTGSTYDQTTALLYDQLVASGKSAFIKALIMANNSAGNIAVRSSVANALTFTLHGMEIDNADSEWTYKMLGQLRPPSTTAASLYALPAATVAHAKGIVIANTGVTAAAYSVFFHDSGTTFDETTAILWEQSLAAGVSNFIDLDLGMATTGGNIAVRSSVASALTFTLYGEEQ